MNKRWWISDKEVLIGCISSIIMRLLAIVGLKQSWDAKAVSGSGIVYLWWVHIAAVCWGYWWIPIDCWQAKTVSSAADLAGASLGVALPVTILTEVVIVLVRMLTQDRRERLLGEGKEELLQVQKAKLKTMLENGEIDQQMFDLLMERLSSP